MGSAEFISTRFPYISQPTFQRQINFENEAKSDVGFSTLHDIDSMSVLDVKTTLHNVEKLLYNFGTTLMQRCFNLASTLFKAILVMIVDCEIVE